MSICFAAVVLSACASPPDTYRTPTKSDVKRFIEHYNIKPSEVLATKNIGQATEILFRTKKKTGAYAFSIDRNGKWSYGGAFVPNESNGAPVRLLGVAGIDMIIEDPGLLAKAYKVKVTFEDGFTAEELVNGKRGHILAYGDDKARENLSYRIMLADKNGEIIYGFDTATDLTTTTESRNGGKNQKVKIQNRRH
jgi:hypothetical protein